jgi:hypothetical protein
MSVFQYTARHVTQLSWKCCQHLLLIYTIDVKLWLPKLEKEMVKFTAQIKTVRSTIRYVCVMHFLLREVKWLNYTPETVCNNRYIVQRTLIIPEYSKNPHFDANQKIKLRARFDQLMMLWLSRWVYFAASRKCSPFYMRKQRI